MVIEDEFDFPSPYCEDCGACGEEGCCKPTMCRHTARCLYPQYLDILHNSYRQIEKIAAQIYQDPPIPDERLVQNIEYIIREENVF